MHKAESKTSTGEVTFCDRHIDTELLYKYAQQGPRYTSYPTALELKEVGSEFENRAANYSIEQDRPLSLYLHIPYCRHLCYYCACNKVVTKKREKALPYLAALKREISLKAALYRGKTREVRQLHLGGGTPTFLDATLLEELFEHIEKAFHFAPITERDFSIEIDPREFDTEQLEVLKRFGFKRASLGIQDINASVQKAIHREQTTETVERVYRELRGAGFESINFDLIYGLPKQTVASFKATLDEVIRLGPNRLSIFNYAHLPHRFPAQKRILATDLPCSADKIALLQLANDRLSEAGYTYIGMDHFTKPDDLLAVAAKDGTLHRNFQGYSTHSDCDLIAMGASAISQIGPFCIQNHHDIETYCDGINTQESAIYRGFEANRDDLIRREAIMSVLCHYQLEFDVISHKFGIVVEEYFADELARLAEFEKDGLLVAKADAIYVTPRGRPFLRNICMTFDAYISTKPTQSFSKVI